MARSKLAGFGTRLVSSATLISSLALVAALGACAPTEEEDPAVVQAAAWEELESKKEALEAKRAEIAEARAELAALENDSAPAAAGDEAAEPAATAEELQAELDRLEAERDELQADFGGALADWINEAGITEGAELTPEQRKAFDWKGYEDVLVGREYIEKGGDYQRAIDIYEQALLFDPENEELKAAIAEAEERRYPTKEAFDRVEKGMTQRQVREILGPVFHRNVKPYPENNAVAWFYRRADGSGASAVFFRESKKDAGDWKVYAVDWEVPVGGGDDEAG